MVSQPITSNIYNTLLINRKLMLIGDISDLKKCTFILWSNFHFFTDVLVEIIKQLTDINDEDREIVQNLEKASYRRFAFTEVKSVEDILYY